MPLVTKVTCFDLNQNYMSSTTGSVANGTSKFLEYKFEKYTEF